MRQADMVATLGSTDVHAKALTTLLEPECLAKVAIDGKGSKRL